MLLYFFKKQNEWSNKLAIFEMIYTSLVVVFEKKQYLNVTFKIRKR